jgi:hypothetical protein
MKRIRRIFTAFLLTSVFALTALATDGIMHGDVVPKPTPTPYAPTSVDAAGDETTTIAPSENEVTATDIAIECALRVLGETLLLY